MAKQFQTRPSQFSPKRQIERSESKTVAALERLSEAFRVLLWRAGKEHTISPIAVQIITFLRHHKPEHCTVGYIAQEFNMTKQTVSDAILTLERKGHIEKVVSAADARVATLRLTTEGKRLAEQVHGFAEPIEAAVATLGEDEQTALLAGLLSMIRSLNEADVISTQRMCFTCRFYAEHHSGSERYCHLLQMPLLLSGVEAESTALVRLDCAEHQAR